MRDDGILPSVATSATDDPTRLGGVAPKPKRTKTKSSLDGADARALLTRLKEWYEQEWKRQSANRFQMAMDEDYYDSIQWSDEDAEELMNRGQAPVVYNEIKATVDWMIGTERRTKVDYKVLPRRKEASDDAEVKSKLLKYLSDVNQEPMARSLAFAQAAKAGMGWIEVGARGDSTDEPVYYRAQSWRYMLYDSNSVELDLADSRYVFRWKYLDEDIASAYFPERKEIIKRAVLDGTSATGGEDDDDLWYMGARVTEPGQDFASSAGGKYQPYDGSVLAGTRRERVKLIECWYRDPEKIQVMRGGPFAGQPFEKSVEQQEAVDSGECSIHDRIEMSVRCAIYCDAGLLYDGPSPYKHGKFPFVPVWAYRRSRDNAPYGAIRTMRDAQDGMNKRASKALWILSTNQIELEEGAVDDIEELRDEAARPDAVIVRKKGKELVIHRDNALADQHLRLMDLDQLMIRSIGGVTAENLGRETNADSGKAIIARQEQGSVVTTQLFDNLRFAIQRAGEIELSLIEQFFDQPRVIRLVGDRGTAKFVELNTPDPETGEILNDVTKSQADFYIAQQDYRDSLRQSMFESLMDIVARLAQMAPEIAFKMLDLVVELADVPNRDELVSRIRQLNGMRDPERDPTPEEQAQIQAQQQEQAMQKQLMVSRAKAELSELESKIDKLDAEAVEKRLAAMRSALEAAGMVAMSPGIANTADSLMHGAGHVDQAPRTDVLNQKIIANARDESSAMQQEEMQKQAMQQQAMQPPAQPPIQPEPQGIA